MAEKNSSASQEPRCAIAFELALTAFERDPRLVAVEVRFSYESGDITSIRYFYRRGSSPKRRGKQTKQERKGNDDAGQGTQP